MDRFHIDPIYDYIEIEDKEIFEIISKHSLKGELERLKEIKHLGIIQKIYSLSKHSKFEHALGVYYLANLVDSNIKNQLNRAKIQSKDLKLASIFHGIGHLPYTYATEKAVCSLYFANKELKQKVDSIISTVCDKLDIKGRKKTYLLGFLKEGDYHELHRWFEAYKILTKDFPEDNKNIVARYVVDKDTAGFRLLRFLDRIDYVIRDAYYINLFSLKINLVPFIRGIKLSKSGEITPPPDINVIGSYYSLLKEKVYRNPKVIAIENIFSRKLMEILNNENEMDFDFLMQKATDAKLEEYLKTYCLGGDKEIPLSEVILMIKDGTISLVYSEDILSEGTKNPWQLERKITHVRSTLLDYPKKEGYFIEVEKSSGEDVISPLLIDSTDNMFRVYVFWNSRSGDPKRVLRSVTELQKMSIQEPILSPKKMVGEFILGGKIQLDYDRIRGGVEEDITNFLSKNSHDNILNCLSSRTKLYKTLEYFLEQPIEEKDELDKLIKDIFVNGLITSPEIFKQDFLADLIGYLQKIRAKGKHKEILIEYIRYIERIKESIEKGNSWWIFPSVKIIDDNGEVLREIDIMSIEFKDINTKPILYLDEKSVTGNSTKITKTKNKFGYIQKMVSDRFPRKIRFEYYFNSDKINLD